MTSRLIRRASQGANGTHSLAVGGWTQAHVSKSTFIDEWASGQDSGQIHRFVAGPHDQRLAATKSTISPSTKIIMHDPPRDRDYGGNQIRADSACLGRFATATVETRWPILRRTPDEMTTDV